MACSADAIVFGNVHDKGSAINKIREENVGRSFYVLEQLHVLPNVSYLAKVRNTNEIIEQSTHPVGTGGHDDAAVPAGEHKKEEAH